MARVSKKIHFPTTRFAELAARSGGVSRDQAIEEATKSIDGLRDHAVSTIDTATATLEAILQSARGGRIEPEQMRKVLREADNIVTMAATFGMATLEKIAKSLCDISDGLVSHNMQDAAPVAVHVQAIRLATSSRSELPEAAAEHILGELSKVRAHYKFESLGDTVPAEFGPPTAIAAK